MPYSLLVMIMNKCAKRIPQFSLVKLVSKRNEYFEAFTDAELG